MNTNFEFVSKNKMVHRQKKIGEVTVCNTNITLVEPLTIRLIVLVEHNDCVKKRHPREA